MKRYMLIVVFIMISGYAHAQNKTHINTTKDGVALDGFDPVAYLLNGKAEMGSEKFSATYDGAVFYFTSASSMNLFKKNPSLYIPAYGGWCAFAMGDYGEKVRVDPYTFKIIDGRVYLFYNFYFNNTLESWNKNEARLKQSAEKNWMKIINVK